MTDALVAVVIVVHNDAERLPRAVESALGQSLHSLELLIVDDASTDGTEDVARRLCHKDSRLRYHRLESNRGAAGRPRNIGMSLTSAPYLLFLDSDDTLDRHACRNLFEAARRSGSDITAGRCVRIHVDRGGEVTPWY
ncbi:MAG: glycosyltransferase family 2 protein, partial [Actinomycetales bacterium]